MSKIDDNKVVWLTGASSGIGEALAYRINRSKANLVISSRRKEELQRVKENCAFPEKVKILVLDLADADSLSQKTEEAISMFGRIDILINNGGVSQRAKIMETEMEVDRRLMEINYFGTIGISKALLPHQVKQGKGHQIVITSALGIISTPLRSAYAASKHALHGFYDALRAEHHHDGLKVTLVCPGFIKTNISINALTGDGSKQNKMDEGQDKGMTADECAKKIIKAIQRNKEEVYFGGLKEVTAMYVKRFFPGLFSRIIRNSKVT